MEVTISDETQETGSRLNSPPELIPHLVDIDDYKEQNARKKLKLNNHPDSVSSRADPVLNGSTAPQDPIYQTLEKDCHESDSDDAISILSNDSTIPDPIEDDSCEILLTSNSSQEEVNVGTLKDFAVSSASPATILCQRPRGSRTRTSESEDSGVAYSPPEGSEYQNGFSTSGSRDDPPSASSQSHSSQNEEAPERTFPCLNVEHGCDSSVTLATMGEHAPRCQFRPKYLCPMKPVEDNCLKRLTSSFKLIEHFVEDHGLEVIDLEFDFNHVLQNRWGLAHTQGEFVISNVLLYEKTLLIVAYKCYPNGAHFWVWDLENKWGLHKLIIKCESPQTEKEKSLHVFPDLNGYAKSIGASSTSNALTTAGNGVLKPWFMEPVPYELDYQGHVQLPEMQDPRTQFFEERDIYNYLMCYSNQEQDCLSFRIQLF